MHCECKRDKRRMRYSGKMMTMGNTFRHDIPTLHIFLCFGLVIQCFCKRGCWCGLVYALACIGVIAYSHVMFITGSYEKVHVKNFLAYNGATNQIIDESHFFSYLGVQNLLLQKTSSQEKGAYTKLRTLIPVKSHSEIYLRNKKRQALHICRVFIRVISTNS